MALDRTQPGIAEIFANLEPSIAIGSTVQYYRGDKTWQSLPTSMTWSAITGTPTSLSGYGITDPVVLTSGSYSNPAWIAGLAYSKLSGAPTLGTASTHATGDFDAAGAAATAQAFAIQRANHTGTQTASTISDFSAAAISAVTWSTLTGKPTFATVATSGAYADLSGLPSIGTQFSVDSGWTANSTVGDKTAALAAYSNGINGTMVTALNVVSGGTGTALSAGFDVLVNVVKQVAAIRTALIVAKIPNV